MFRKSLAALRAFLFNPITVLILSSLILGVVLWYLGPLVSVAGVRPFDGVGDRIIATGSLVAATTIAVLLILLHRRSADTAMSQAIADASAEDAAVDAELAELSTRMKDALKTLGGARLGGLLRRNPLYQLPWYVMIGPPGAGKTTAIAKSGLHFPLADTLGKAAIGGVGGTRNCDWWFTNEAVLLDTAGRYTTQDSNETADARAWTGFLDMLKRHRRRQPINGAIVAISLADLAQQDEAATAAHARAIRIRLAELRDRLGVRFPVYVLFTKADLVAGFQEFFDPLGQEAREQVWGVTLPLDSAGSDPAAGFGAEFDALLARLGDQSLERMQQESDFQRRSLVAGFPAQMASLRGVTAAFLADVFQPNRYAESPLLRGVYFTSGTQEGLPIDRLMAGMARTFGIGRQAVGSGQGQGRSYFLTRLLRDVIVGEAGLVSADDAVERRTRWATRGAVALGGLALAALLGVLWTSFAGNRALIADAGARIGAFRAEAAQIPPSPVADDDVAGIVPALDILRDLPGNPAATDPEPPRALTWGLYQGDAIGTESAQSYRAALNTLLLPRLLVRLENRMQSSLNDTDALFAHLKTYLMLGLQVPMDQAHVTQALAADWTDRFPRDAALRAALTGHLDALLTQPMQEIALNGPLIEQARGILSQTPLSERVYRSIVTAPEALALPDFRITEVGGPAATRVLVRPSGRPLSAGIEGVFTRAGFYDHVLPQILSAADRVQRDSVILGRGEDATSQQALALASRDVLALYESDYVARYDDLLADIDILPMASLGQATDVLNILTGPVSPLRNILDAVARETRLTVLPQQDVVVDSAVGEVGAFLRDEVVTSLGVDAETIFNNVSAAIAALPGEEAVAPGQFVEDRFAALHRLTDRPDGTASELDRIVALMTDVHDDLNRLSLGQNLGSALVGGERSAAARLQAEIARMPAPMERWSAQVVQASAGAAVGGARTELNAKWRAEVLGFCTQALTGRYPFDRQSQADMGLQDFGRLFAPGGLIDAFFAENLAPFVDTTVDPWQVRRVNGVDIGISNAVVAQFQRAAEIKDSFFAGPGLPSVRFDVTPVALDPNVEQVTFEVDGQSVVYAHGPPQVSALAWPGQAGARTRVAFSPTRGDRQNALSQDGPWALFRLLDLAELRRTNVTDRNRVVFNLGGRIAIFQLRAGSALNPFTVGALDTFRCPASL